MYDEIIDEYIGEVVKGLDSRRRREAIRELRTHILDSADALAAGRNVPVDEAIVREVITRMGPAEKIGAMYTARESFLWKQVDRISNLAKPLTWAMIGSLLAAAVLAFVMPFSIAGISMPAILVIAYWLAFIVIAIANICICLVEPRLKAPYDVRLKRLIGGFMGPTSPIGVATIIIILAFWIISLNLYWSKVCFVADFSQGTRLIPLLSPGFAGFLPYINSLTLLTIAALLLYIVVEQRWVINAMETVLAIAWALLAAWILLTAPFNPELSAGVVAVFKAIIAVATVAGLFGTVKKLWKAARAFMRERQGPKMMI